MLKGVRYEIIFSFLQLNDISYFFNSMIRLLKSKYSRSIFCFFIPKLESILFLDFTFALLKTIIFFFLFVACDVGLLVSRLIPKYIKTPT